MLLNLTENEHFFFLREPFYGLEYAENAFAPDSTGGAHDAHPDLLVGWGGDTRPRSHPTRRLDRSGLSPVDVISGYASGVYS